MSDARQLDLEDYAAAQAAKNSALNLLESTRRAWVERCRRVADEIWEATRTPITVNMLRERCGAPPGGEDPRAFGCLLRKPRWKCIGYVESGRVVSHGRRVAEFVRTV